MLALEKMQKVRVFSPRDEVKTVISKLYDFGGIQVQECKIADLDSPLQEFQETSEMLIRLRAEERGLVLKGSPEAKEAAIPEIKAKFDSFQFEELDKKRKSLQELESQLQALQDRKKALLPFKTISSKLHILKSEKVSIAYFEIKPNTQKATITAFKKIATEILFVKDENRTFAALAYDSRQTDKVTTIVSTLAIATFNIPEIEGTYKEELDRINVQTGATKSEIENLKSWLEDYKKKNGQEILALKEQLKIASMKAELPFKFGKTDHFSVVEGWIEEKHLGELKGELEALESVVLETVQTSETPPSKLSNPKLIRPFEFMVEFFSLPKSYELDPTLFISITYPLFFGMIMGDIGYGMLALFTALAIKLKGKGDLMKRIGGMLALSALSAIIFGIIFGEFFGLEHIFGTQLVPLLHRSKEVEELINISLLIGVLHLALGYIIGAYTQYSHGHKKHAGAKLSWLLVEITLIATIINLSDVSLLHIFTPLKQVIGLTPALIGLVLGAIGIALLESPTYLMELPSLLSNILSYLRIAALGLSGVIIALIINKLPVDFDGFFAMITLAKPFNFGAFLAFIIFATILIVGHIVALALAILESGVQSLRLHYVEFFSKFYEGGGLPFVPLRKREDKG